MRTEAPSVRDWCSPQKHSRSTSAGSGASIQKLPSEDPADSAAGLRPLSPAVGMSGWLPATEMQPGVEQQTRPQTGGSAWQRVGRAFTLRRALRSMQQRQASNAASMPDMRHIKCGARAPDPRELPEDQRLGPGPGSITRREASEAG